MRCKIILNKQEIQLLLRGKRTSSPVNFASEVLVLGFGILTVTQNNCRKRHLRECSVVENFLSQKLQSLPNNISEEKIQFYTEKNYLPLLLYFNAYKMQLKDFEKRKHHNFKRKLPEAVPLYTIFTWLGGGEMNALCSAPPPKTLSGHS